MGASGWGYIIPLADPRAAFDAARRQTLAGGEFYPYWEDADDLGGQPAGVEELDAVKEQEEFWEIGTHSILDMDRLMGPSDEDHDGTVRRLPDDLAIATFGTATPTLDQFIAVQRTDLPVRRRWSGFFIPIVHDGQATHVAFWGFSGD